MNISRKYLFLAGVIILFALIWSKLRIVVFVGLSLGQAVLIFGVTAVVLFFIIDHLINRSRD